MVLQGEQRGTIIAEDLLTKLKGGIKNFFGE
jgi:hypothetical protein